MIKAFSYVLMYLIAQRYVERQVYGVAMSASLMNLNEI